MFKLVLVVRGQMNVSNEEFTCIGDAVVAWRNMGQPAKDKPDLAYVAEVLFEGYLERVTVPLGYTVNHS